MTDVNHCGTCTMCCKLPALVDDGVAPAKPVNKWCTHCEIGVGCRVYEKRTDQCSGFECLWLVQKHEPELTELPIELRPDKSHCVICPTTSIEHWQCYVDPQYPDAWKRDDVLQLLGRIVMAYGHVIISHGHSTEKISIEKHPFQPNAIITRKVKVSEPDENGMQWASAL